MTLVLTRLTPHGIAMAADTAVRTTVPDGAGGGKTHTVKPSATEKLFRIKGLCAGVSCWGVGSINGMSTSDWLTEFMQSRESFPDIRCFAHLLEGRLNLEFKGRLDGEASIGFHVAGYEAEGTGPTFYHVHDGPSEMVANVCPTRINANHDCPPALLKKLFDEGRIQEMRCGEFRPYTVIRDALGKAFDELNIRRWPSVEFKQIEDVTKYNVLEIRLMSDLYSLFGKPVIGGDIDALEITSAGAGEVVRHENSSGIRGAFTYREEPVKASQSPGGGDGSSGFSYNMTPGFVAGTSHVPPSGIAPQMS